MVMLHGLYLPLVCIPWSLKPDIWCSTTIVLLVAKRPCKKVLANVAPESAFSLSQAAFCRVLSTRVHSAAQRNTPVSFSEGPQLFAGALTSAKHPWHHPGTHQHSIPQRYGAYGEPTNPCVDLFQVVHHQSGGSLVTRFSSSAVESWVN